MASQDVQPFHWHYTELDDKRFEVHGHTLQLIVILFAILLLFTFLCLYARWVCRYRQLAAARTRVNQNPLPERRSESSGLDPATIESLPVQLHRSSAEEVQCSICLSNFIEEEKVKMLPNCNHAFHPLCVDKWLSTQSSCPLCRGSLAESVV
ncbi:RING-H2 finger protein ATL66-like [Tasmannia lanceolata]|uniref:RING-H2 finger protein ATL66-like n=1 Tax=Tasmannia lanceolata TaxID=3420 RepID=UPI004064A715